MSSDIATLRTDDAPEATLDPAGFVRHLDDGTDTLHLMVEGAHCANCIRAIENALKAEDGVVEARLNLSTRRLAVRWRGGASRAGALVDAVTRLGYGAVPFDPVALAASDRNEQRMLMRCLAVAGFAAANVMLLSVAVWSGAVTGMGPATRDLLHWISALIVLPATAYAIRPFAASALQALRAGRLNMDVPITLAVVLAAGMSLFETVRHGQHVYFDAAAMLMFFLLIGRVLDRGARGKARGAAERLSLLSAGAATVIAEDGTARSMPVALVRPGMTVAVAAGERIPVDGTVIGGRSDIDTSLVTGETVPVAAAPGDGVFAGTINLTGALRLRATAADQDTLLAEIAGMMEAAAQGRARYVRLADRAAGIYAPAVHLLALGAFLGWTLIGGMAWQPALMIAISVLIITCPCALGLAVPVVQVVAGGLLMKRGVILKSPDGLERLAETDTVVFDKTGTLTVARPELDHDDSIADADLRLAASLAAASRHPLCRALARAAGPAAVADNVTETPGIGLAMATPDGEVRLGSRIWCGVDDDPDEATERGPEIWLAKQGAKPVRFGFRDTLREDAANVVAALRRRGLAVMLLSGDRKGAVAAIAAAAGIEDWRAAQRPADKVARLERLAEDGKRAAMIGDGLNDAPALAAAHASMSPAAAADISRTAADALFQGDRLAPVAETLCIARAARRLMLQNFALAAAYNAVAVPLAMAGMVTPLIAAVAMSASSLVVTLNALRLNRVKP